METNNNINNNDSILAMLTRNGKVIAQVNTIGFSSIAEIIATLKNLAGSTPGLFQLFIRNFSQGWHINKPMFLNQERVATSIPKANINKYGQYMLNF